MASRLERRIERIKGEIRELGPLHPGRITKQFNVCGTPGCRCKDPQNPRKHGPYHYLSYTFQGRSKTVFVPKGCVAEMNRRAQRYRRLKGLVEELVEASVRLAKEEVLQRKEPS